MKFETNIRGRIMNIGQTKKEGLYMITIYSDKKLFNVLTENIQGREIDDEIEVHANIITNDYLIKEAI